jgi:hypothetical protein
MITLSDLHTAQSRLQGVTVHTKLIPFPLCDADPRRLPTPSPRLDSSSTPNNSPVGRPAKAKPSVSRHRSSTLAYSDPKNATKSDASCGPVAPALRRGAQAASANMSSQTLNLSANFLAGNFRLADNTSSERVLALAANYWSVLDEHPPSLCRDGERARGAL